MATELWAIGVYLLGSFFGAIAQYFFKRGAPKLTRNFYKLITNWEVILGLFIYAICTAAGILAYPYGEISILYPLVATSYIWVCIISATLLKERMNTLKWMGILAIILGVTAIGFGATIA